MAQFQNIAERIVAVAEEHGDRVAVVLPHGEVTYARLRQLILAYAQHAMKRGIGRGSVVAIDIENVVMKGAMSLACTLIGAVCVSAPLPVIRASKLACTHLVFGTKNAHEQSPTQLLVDFSWSVAPPGPPAPLDCSGADDIWGYAASSGTTGVQKFMPFTLGAMEASVQRETGLPAGMRPVMTYLAPPGGQASLPFPILARGGTGVIGASLDRMLKFGTNLVNGSPAQYAKLLANAKPSDRKIHLAVVFGAAVSEPQLARMLGFFEKIKIFYGATEVGFIAERVVDSLPYDPTHVGKVQSNAEVEVVDDEDRPLPPGEEGLLRMRRADVPWRGYVDAQGTARSPFRDDWFYPGDIGRLSKDGELHIIGRRDDRLNLGGVKVDASRIDAIIQDTPGVKDGYCFEDRDESGVSYLALLLSLEDIRHPDKVVQNIYNALNASGLFYRIKRAYLASEIPRTETGKPLRRLATDFVQKQSLFNIKFREPPVR